MRASLAGITSKPSTFKYWWVDSQVSESSLAFMSQGCETLFRGQLGQLGFWFGASRLRRLGGLTFSVSLCHYAFELLHCFWLVPALGVHLSSARPVHQGSPFLSHLCCPPSCFSASVVEHIVQAASPQQRGACTWILWSVQGQPGFLLSYAISSLHADWDVPLNCGGRCQAKMNSWGCTSWTRCVWESILGNSGRAMR